MGLQKIHTTNKHLEVIIYLQNIIYVLGNILDFGARAGIHQFKTNYVYSMFLFQDYSFQCYFRQRWFDNRLRFDIRNITEVTLNNLFLSHIWKPNTYFLNGQRSNQHNITVPNLFVRIRDDGRVYLSRRSV